MHNLELWLKEEIPYIKNSNWLYKIVCFFKGKRKLTYEEMFLILYGINKGHLGEKEAKRKALERILIIYKEHHNNKLPD